MHESHLHNIMISCKPLILIIAGISIVHLHIGVSIVAVTLGAAFTLRKWYLLEKEEKRRKEAEKKQKDGE